MWRCRRIGIALLAFSSIFVSFDLSGFVLLAACLGSELENLHISIWASV